MIISKFIQGEYRYFCTNCIENKRPHFIAKIPNGVTKYWGPGIPSHISECQGCGDISGPWIDADDVGGGY